MVGNTWSCGVHNHEHHKEPPTSIIHRFFHYKLPAYLRQEEKYLPTMLCKPIQHNYGYYAEDALQEVQYAGIDDIWYADFSLSSLPFHGGNTVTLVSISNVICQDSRHAWFTTNCMCANDSVPE